MLALDGADGQRITNARSLASQAGFTRVHTCRSLRGWRGGPSGIDRPSRDDTGEATIGLGDLGTTGGSIRSGDGAGGRGARGAAARVRMGRLDVRGSLSRELVRRVLARHEGEVRACYEPRLAAHPELEGRVLVSFTIGPSGSVVTASIGNSTLHDMRVEECIVQVVRRWTFPASDGGGVVGVNAPFVLSAGD